MNQDNDILTNKISGCISDTFDKIDSYVEKDSMLLKEFIQEKMDNLYTELTEAQETIIIEACRETYRASSVLTQAYVHTVITDLVPLIRKEIKSEIMKSYSQNEE